MAEPSTAGSAPEPVATDTSSVAQVPGASTETTQTADVKASPSQAPGETKETLLEAVMKAVKPSDDDEGKTPGEAPPPSEGAETGTEAGKAG